MRKIILSIATSVFIFSVITAEAQEQGFSLGAQLGASWNHNVTIQARDTLFWTVAPCLKIRTEYTEHSLSFDFINNKLHILNAFCIEHAFDIYINYEQDVTIGCPKGMYGSFGAKKTVAPARGIEITIFGELGNNLICTSFVRFGLILHPQFYLNGNGGYSDRGFSNQRCYRRF